MPAGLTLIIALSLGSAGPAVPQSSGLGPEERTAILLGYQLTLGRANQLISAMTAVTQYLVALPDFQTRLARSAKLTPAERRAQMEQDPRISDILKQNSLTARDYLVGVPPPRRAGSLGPGWMKQILLVDETGPLPSAR